MRMSPSAPRRKRAGPGYYRLPAFWGLVATLVIVVLLMTLLFRMS